MLKIAICDDDKNMVETISNILWQHQKEKQLEWKTYLSGESLIKAIREHENFDLLFLDIEMGQLSGIDVADILRNELNNYSTQLVFVTNKENRAKEACSVLPLDFIDKPVNKERILSVVDRAFKILGDNRRYFSYIKDGEQNRVLYKDIYYFKSEGKTIKIISELGKFEYRGSLKKIEKKLEEYGFVRTYKSYIINSKNIDYMSKNEVIMINEDKIPISRDYRKKIAKYFKM